MRWIVVALAAALALTPDAEAQTGGAPQLTIPIPGPETCASAETRAPFLAGFEALMTNVMAHGQEMARYNEQETERKQRLMIERGLWTEAQSQSFHMALLEDAQFSQHTQNSMNAVMAMMQGFQAMEAAPDETVRCARGIDTINAAQAVITRTEAQWRYMSDAYDTEARRRGGTLE